MKKICILALAISASTGALALGNYEPNAQLQFNFSNPGARSLGMGGAYLGFSDDATAAYTNPAGLANLGTKELFFEMRQSRFNNLFLNGDANGNPFIDSESSRTSSPTFFAFVYPGEGWALAAYRNVEIDFESTFAANSINVGNGNIFPLTGQVEAEIVNYGLSGSFSINDQLSLGISGVYSMLDYSSGVLRITNPAENRFNIQFEVGEDESYGATIGLLYKWNEQLSLGAAYRHGASLDLPTRTARGTFGGGNFNVESVSSFGTGAFDVPHQFSVGAAYRVTEQLALGLDVHYIDYDRLGNDPLRSINGNRNQFDSGTEIRLGGEYVFATEVPITVRAGVWRDPAHRYTFEGTPTNFDEVVDALIFFEGDDETHVSVGFGLAFENGQLDFGADFSDLVDVYSLSAGLRF